ncbi:hypothetical protein PENTCL1PPCAC_17014, partial [Pristionchus entomophagus]
LTTQNDDLDDSDHTHAEDEAENSTELTEEHPDIHLIILIVHFALKSRHEERETSSSLVQFITSNGVGAGGEFIGQSSPRGFDAVHFLIASGGTVTVRPGG